MKISINSKIFKAMIIAFTIFVSFFTLGLTDTYAFDYDNGFPDIKNEPFNVYTNDKNILQSKLDLINSYPYVFTTKGNSKAPDYQTTYYASDVPFKITTKGSKMVFTTLDSSKELHLLSFRYIHKSTYLIPNYHTEFSREFYLRSDSNSDYVNLEDANLEVIYSSFELKLNDDVLFQVPLVKVAEVLLPQTQGEAMTIVVAVVFLIGLWVLLTLLSKRFKLFYRG